MITQIAKDACIILWGQTLYLDYEYLEIGNDNSNHPDLLDGFKDVVDAFNNKDDKELEELVDWFQDGASYGGVKLLTKNTYDIIMESNQTILIDDLRVFRTGDFYNIQKGYWLSFSMEAERYGRPDDKEHTFIIEKGKPIIYTRGLADHDEVIIKSDIIVDIMNNDTYIKECNVMVKSFPEIRL